LTSSRLMAVRRSMFIRPAESLQNSILLLARA
jgi:hypothetical protein